MTLQGPQHPELCNPGLELAGKLCTFTCTACRRESAAERNRRAPVELTGWHGP